MPRQKKEVNTEGTTSVQEPINESSEILSDVKIQKSTKELSKELLKKFIEEEIKLVKGKFRCYEVPGSSQRIIVKKYPGIPVFDKVMQDDCIYEIPLYVARHLNGIDVTAKKVDGKIHTCSFATHGFKWENGKEVPRNTEDGGFPVPIIQPQKWTRRYGFESLEFGMEQ